MKKNQIIINFACALALSAMPAHAQKFNPPMLGWSSWNTFALNISEDVILGQAQAMKDKGLAKAGYSYINIDDGFWNGRAADGQLIVDTKKFPHGMRYVADKIHSLGLNAGIYSDAGDNTCGSGQREPWGLNVGMAGYEEEDCKTYFIDWDYDFIKVDYCGGSHMGLDEKEQYTKISNAIKSTAEIKGKPIAFNVCRWAFPGTWISDIADSWRTTGDIYDAWKSVKSIIEENLYIQAYTGGGRYNDMDMLEIGRSMNENEERTHMAYWCIASSPLLIGCDMRTLRESSLKLLTNKDLLAMNQDRLGLGAPVVQRDGDVYMVAKDMEKLHGKKRAVVVMNLGDQDKDFNIDFSALELWGDITIHDCFTKKDITTGFSNMHVTVPAHGSLAYIMTGKRSMKKVYEAEEAWLKSYQELFNRDTARPVTASGSSMGAYVGYLGGNMVNYLEWRNVYVDKAGSYQLNISYASGDNRDLTVNVNGRDMKYFTGLNSGSWDNNFKTVQVTVNLNKGMNTVRLNNDRGYAPNIDKMEVVEL